MIEFAHLVYLVFLPSVIAGLGIAVVWRYVDSGPLRTALQTIAAILFFVPQPFALFLGAYSAGLRAYQQVLLAAWGLGTGALMVRRLRLGSAPAAQRPGALTRAARWRPSADEIRRTEYVVTAIRERGSPERRPNRFILGAAAIAMIALGIYCGWNAVGDYLLAHDSVAGTVEGARVIRNTRSPRTALKSLTRLSRLSPDFVPCRRILRHAWTWQTDAGPLRCATSFRVLARCGHPRQCHRAGDFGRLDGTGACAQRAGGCSEIADSAVWASRRHSGLRPEIESPTFGCGVLVN
jgi:hypothetical protein